MKPRARPESLPVFLTVEEAAHLLRVTPRTLLTWLRLGKLRGTKIGHAWRVPSAIVLHHMQRDS